MEFMCAFKAYLDIILENILIHKKFLLSNPQNFSLKINLLPYSGFISLGANFPEWSVLSFSRNFPDLEIHDPNNQKIHVSEIHTKFAHVHECLDTGNR